MEAEQARARTALWNAVQGNGIQVLDNAAVLGEVLADRLSDAPAERHVLVAAAEAGTASALRRHILEQHLDPTAAVRAAATDLAARTGIADERCVWAVAEFSQAMGFPVSVMPGPEEQPQPPSAWAPPGPNQPHTPPPSQYPNQPQTPPPGQYANPLQTPPPSQYPAPPNQGNTPPPGTGQGWSQAPAPSRPHERRGLLIGGALGGVALLILVGYLGVAGAAKLPPFASSSSKHKPTPTPTPVRTTSPSQGPAPLPSGLKPLAQLLPNDVTYPGGCNDGSAKMAPYYPGLVSELSCDASDNSYIAVYAFQFDNTGDYTNGFTTYNASNGFTSASASGSCPPSGSGQGDTSWTSKSNTDFSSSAGQELECWQPPNQHPTYLYTMQHFNTFIVATDTLSWNDLDLWWKKHGTR